MNTNALIFGAVAGGVAYAVAQQAKPVQPGGVMVSEVPGATRLDFKPPAKDWVHLMFAQKWAMGRKWGIYPNPGPGDVFFPLTSFAGADAAVAFWYGELGVDLANVETGLTDGDGIDVYTSMLTAGWSDEGKDLYTAVQKLIAKIGERKGVPYGTANTHHFAALGSNDFLTFDETVTFWTFLYHAAENHAVGQELPDDAWGRMVDSLKEATIEAPATFAKWTLELAGTVGSAAAKLVGGVAGGLLDGVVSALGTGPFLVAAAVGGYWLWKTFGR